MRVGIFADTHDHLDNIRRAVEVFNEAGCERVVFAGDFVSTIALPPLRKLKCPLIASFGDNEGNKVGLYAGMKILGTLGEPPFCFRTKDGTRFVIAHMSRQLRGADGKYDVVIYAHTHKPEVRTDDSGRLWINPGETSGWTYGRPTVAVLETGTREVEIVALRGGKGTGERGGGKRAGGGGKRRKGEMAKRVRRVKG